MKIALVGGVFDEAGGRPSGYVRRLGEALIQRGVLGFVVNGGHLTDMLAASNQLGGVDAVLWFADVPNEYPKFVEGIKPRWPKLYLVTSKRNFGHTYGRSEILGRALKTKSNLLVEITGSKNSVEATVWDPLGTIYCLEETDIALLAEALDLRLRRLAGFTRVGSERVGEKIPAPSDDAFYGLVREQAERFHEIIHGVGHERMMGNASFRCAKGFPSVRSGNLIFVSRRDIDKRFIAPENFVAVDADSANPVRYYGPEKPSVDTPIQVRLYRHYRRVRYMLHSHTYVEGAPHTSEPVPCGAIEEAAQVIALFPDPDTTDFVVNLRGHGSIAFASGIEGLSSRPWYARRVPEPYLLVDGSPPGWLQFHPRVGDPT